MQVRSEKPTRFSDEIKLIHPAAWIVMLAAICFMQFLFHVYIPNHPHPGREVPPLWMRACFGVLAGIAVSCWVLLVGYINRDSARRGMSRTIWTLLAIFVPNGLGIILFFLLRQPLPNHCPHCQATVQPGYAFCSKCGKDLQHHCPKCLKPVQDTDTFCPYCGANMTSTAPSVPSAP